jgi:Flp pilus assembly protein TadD
MKLALSATLVAGAAYLGPQGRRQAEEFVWLYRAERAPVYSASQIDLLRHAFSIDPMDSETAYYIGEALRHQSQQGSEASHPNASPAYRQSAEQAMQWYQRGMTLNPWDSRSYSGFGWCLDWLDRQSESAPYFSRAEALDPNNYFNLNNIGMHYVQLGDFAAAKPWFERSLRLEYTDNLIARNYLEIANVRLLEAATNEITAKLYSFPK